jgi:hypothetical protein
LKRTVEAEQHSPPEKEEQQLAKTRKAPWRWIVLTALGLVVLCVITWLVLVPSSVPTKSVAWRIQPDQFPMGTVVQGSRVEMSFGVFSGLRPSVLPGFITGLPSPIRKPCEWGITSLRSLKAKNEWGLKVDAPGFLKVDEAQIQFHSSGGPFAFVSVSLKTDQPGRFDGTVIVRLTSSGYAATNITVPVSAAVVTSPSSPRRTTLITQTPYECYSTGNGHDFEPLANLVSRLTTNGVRIDFRRYLPRSISGYSTILFAGDALARADPAQTAVLKNFVSGGGRLILAADAFLVPTTPNANAILSSYGLQIINRDAGKRMTNSTVIADSLTSNVRHLDFWRPAPVKVTDTSQAKLLVTSDDSEGGFVAVSRSPNRGEVIVVTQSLWWNWIRSDSTNVDNCVLLENLLAR